MHYTQTPPVAFDNSYSACRTNDWTCKKDASNQQLYMFWNTEEAVDEALLFDIITSSEFKQIPYLQ